MPLFIRWVEADLYTISTTDYYAHNFPSTTQDFFFFLVLLLGLTGCVCSL